MQNKNNSKSRGFATRLLFFGPLLIQEAVGLKAEISALRAGTCMTIWSHP
jgi:hypothetical protein